MSDRQQVRADLMRAAGLQRHPQERVLGQRALDLEVRDRLVRVVGVGGDASANAPVAAQRRVDRAAPRRRAALDQREVLAGDLARAQRGLQRGMRRAPTRASSSSPDVSRSSRWTTPGRSGGPAGHAARERLHERPLLVPAAWMHDDPRRLVDHEQVLVLVGDPELRRRRRRRAGSRRGLGSTTIVSPPASTWRLGLRHAVDAHAARRRSAAAPSRACRRRRPGRRRAARPRPPAGLFTSRAPARRSATARRT